MSNINEGERFSVRDSGEFEIPGLDIVGDLRKLGLEIAGDSR